MNIGLPEMVVVVIVILLLFGPDKVPEIGRAIGRSVREFKHAMSELEDSIETEKKAGGSSETAESAPAASGGAVPVSQASVSPPPETDVPPVKTNPQPDADDGSAV